MGSDHLQNIAVVGAGGRLGGILTSALVSSGKFKVTAITRPDSATTKPDGLVASHAVDYNNHASLVSALQGQDALVITMNVRAQPDAQEHLIDAAIEAGVKYIIPNEWAFAGAESTVGEESGFGTKTATIRKHIETAAKGRNTHWISITSGFWYEFSLVSSFVAPSSARFGFDHKAKTVTFFDSDGKTKIHTTTWAQTARALVALLSLPLKSGILHPGSPSLAKFNDRSVYIASFQVSQQDIFKSVLRVRGESEKDWTVTNEDVKQRFERGKGLTADKSNFPKFMEGSVIRMYSRIFWPDGSGSFPDKLNNKELGLTEENLDEATKNALALLDEGSKKI